MYSADPLEIGGFHCLGGLRHGRPHNVGVEPLSRAQPKLK